MHTQARVSQWVEIQNGPLSATFTTLVGDTNTVLDAILQFSVVANANNISKIELFSTGGPVTNVTGQSSAVFSVAATNLGLGLHPFYVIVTASSGKQYRTETKWIRLVASANTPFPITIRTPPPRLAWPATAGRRYEILSTTNITQAFGVQDTITASNSAAQWTDTNSAAVQRFYRVRTAN